MTIPLPNLDDRTFTQLVEDARRRIETTCPEWTDLSPHDPGITLVELFAYLTETMLYRLNRLPDKAYVAFLNLLGVQRQAPVAASVVLELRRVTIGQGSGKDAPVFVTEDGAVIGEGETTATVLAHHCERIDGELVGTGDGSAHQVFSVAHPPLTRTTEALDLLVGVQVDPDTLDDGVPAREWEGKTFRIWEPVWSFTATRPGPVYVVDRAEGRITFGPGAEGAVPPAGAEVRVWYRTGGGPLGNVAAGTLTAWRDPVPGVGVTNPEPARGGRAIESMDEVLRRGPDEFLTVRRAVTAADFELLAAQSSGAVARAKALTRADVWSFARPGEVEVVLVPHVPAEAATEGRLDLDVLLAHQTEEARQATQAELDRRRPLGTRCVVEWARYKPVSVKARVVVRREEDADRVRARVIDRLNTVISPVRSDAGGGWRFGQALRRSNVYRLLEQAEPGVQWVDEIRFVVDEAPDGAITALAADRYQPRTWYAGSDEVLFRTTNDGDGWEPAGQFAGERVWVIAPYPDASRPGVAAHAGLLAAATRAAEGGAAGAGGGTSASSIWVSDDLGETWRRIGGLDVGITDLAWTSRGATPELLVATDKGLYELPLLADAAPNQVLVDPADPDRGFYGVEAFTDERGEWSVAVAAQAELGVYLSGEAGRPGSFTMVGLAGEDTRTLAVQLDASGAWLWAGIGEPSPDQPGRGTFRARLFEADVRWEPRQAGWLGGTCWSIAFAGRYALAATQNGGVVRLDLDVAEAAWDPLDVNAGLPLRDRPRFEPVTAVAAAKDAAVTMAGGPKGVHRSDGEGRTWRPTAHREAEEVVTIPDTWLLCSGRHEIEVVSGRATRRD
jgi:hypothetical protein